MVRKSEQRLKPCMNNVLLKKIKQKHRLRVKCNKHPHNICLKNRQNRMSRKINEEIKICRDNYYHNQIRMARGNLKEEWKIVNSIINRNMNDNINSITLNNGGELISDPSAVANAFNKFVVSVGQDSFPRDSSNQCHCCVSPSSGINVFHRNGF